MLSFSVKVEMTYLLVSFQTEDKLFATVKYNFGISFKKDI